LRDIGKNGEIKFIDLDSRNRRPINVMQDTCVNPSAPTALVTTRGRATRILEFLAVPRDCINNFDVKPRTVPLFKPQVAAP